MNYIIQDKEFENASGADVRVYITHNAADRLEISREIYSIVNYQYYVFEILHESFAKNKLVINGRDNPVNFFEHCGKFRVIR